MSEKTQGRLGRSTLLAFALGLGAAGLVALLDFGGLLEALELKTYDARFVVKSRLAPSIERGPIVMIGIDDATFNDPAFHTPLVLWHERFGTVFEALGRAGARVVAFDFMLPTQLFDDTVPGYSRAWMRGIAALRRAGTRFVTGYTAYPTRTLTPHPHYLQIVGADNLAPFNLTTDRDDFVRRHRLWFTRQDGRGRVDTFPLAVAKAFDPGFEPIAQTIFIDFKFPVPAYPHLSLSTVYDRARNNDEAFLERTFAGKIVFIGETDLLSQDRHSTPLNYVIDAERKKIPGVEIHAQIVDSALARKATYEPGQTTRAGIYFALALAAAAFLLLAPQRIAYFGFPLFGLAWPAVATGVFLCGVVLPAAGGLASVLLGAVSAVIVRNFVQDAEKRRLRNMFKRYLHPDIIQRLLAAEDVDFFKGEHKILCILFSDIRGFTTFAESRGPAEVVARLNEYFDAMAEVTAHYGGVVDKFLGDGLMVFFGGFSEKGNASVAGCQTAVAMIRKLDELNAVWAAKGEPTFRIGIGLHTGLVMVGNIGSKNKTEFTIIGDAVNLAARLQDKTKELGVDVLISEAVRLDLAEAMDVEEKGVVEIRGRAPVKTYQLKAPRSSL